MSLWRHWRLEALEGGLQRLWFDYADANGNLLSPDSLRELGDVLCQLARNPPAGLVLQSAKSNGFCLGADINEFIRLKEESDVMDYVRSGQAVMDLLESMPFPTVAIVHGYCLGGGMELALACRYRLAEDNPKTRLGLPEVRLGIHPGFGGSLRLPRLIGALAALPAMLAGRELDARHALRSGWVDDVQPARHLLPAARDWLRRRPPPRRPGVLARAVDLPVLRQAVAAWMQRDLRRRVNPEHYPAPFALLHLWRRHAAAAPAAYLRAEAESVARLALLPGARQMTRAFFLRERIKKSSQDIHLKVNNIHVIGAGVMGADIAAWCALKGFRVSLQDQDFTRVAAAIGRVRAWLPRHLRGQESLRAVLDRLIPDAEGAGLRRADVVIEAIFEDLSAKQTLWRQVEARVPAHCLLASNTSAIPLAQMAAVLHAPQRLIGLHFFNPVPHMPLVEIVHDAASDEDSLRRAHALVLRLGKLPLRVRSAPGFLVNRMLMPYLLAAVEAVADGFDAAAVDEAARAWGMPVGPLELADRVGLDICLQVARELAPLAGRPLPALLQAMVDGGRLGRKTGAGFYVWRKDRPQRRHNAGLGTQACQALQQRLLQPLHDQARRCLEEGIVESADAVNAGALFGMGYPPFRGGPLAS